MRNKKIRLKLKRLAAMVMLAALICASFVFVPTSVHAEEICTDSTGSYQYVRNGRYAKIVKYLGTTRMDAEQTYTLPSKLDGYTVNEIGPDAFAAYSAPSKKIVIPDTVSAIDDRAFEFVLDDEGDPRTKGVRLEQVTLPNSLIYIGDFAFARNRMKTVTIPGSVKFMGRSCFGGTVEKLVIEEGVRRIDEAAFDFWYSNLKEISLPSTLVCIGKEAFGHNWTYGDEGQLDLVIPDSVTKIEEDAFASSNVLGSVKLGAGLQWIEKGAFRGSALNRVDMSDCRSLIYIGEEAFSATPLKTFTVNETTERLEIKERAFYACNELRRISVPDSTYFGKESVGYVYSKQAQGHVLSDEVVVNCISSGIFKPSKYDMIQFHSDISQAAVYSLYENVGLKANFVVKETDTELMKFHAGAKFRLVISGNKGLKWKSSNPKVARISANGSVATVSTGTTTLKTVLNDGTNYSCKLKVTPKSRYW